MSHIPMGGSAMRPNPDWKFDGSMPNVYINMGNTAENVAMNHNVSREDMDKFAVESNRRAYEAIKAGKFKEEIIPIEAFKYKVKNGKRVREVVTFDTDDGVRWPTTVEDLGKLKSPFKLGGGCTAGNSSQMTDGAAFCYDHDSRKGKSIKTETHRQNDALCSRRMYGGRNGRRSCLRNSQGFEDGRFDAQRR